MKDSNSKDWNQSFVKYGLQGCKIITVIYFIIGMLTILACAYILYSFLFIPISPPDSFCSSNDKIYQLLNANAEKWIQVFLWDKSGVLGDFPFSTPDGVYVIVNYGSANLAANGQIGTILYIVAEHGWNERMGTCGYIYSPMGEPHISEYQIEHLDEDIYCYSPTRKA